MIAARLWSVRAVSGRRRHGELPAGHAAGRADRRRSLGARHSVRSPVASLSPPPKATPSVDGGQSSAPGRQRPGAGPYPGREQRLRRAQEHAASRAARGRVEDRDAASGVQVDRLPDDRVDTGRPAAPRHGRAGARWRARVGPRTAAGAASL